MQLVPSNVHNINHLGENKLWGEGAKKRLSEGIYPFGIDSFGNLFCFDYRNKSIPSIGFGGVNCSNYL